jgi:hypothetical protein
MVNKYGAIIKLELIDKEGGLDGKEVLEDTPVIVLFAHHRSLRMNAALHGDKLGYSIAIFFP